MTGLLGTEDDDLLTYLQKNEGRNEDLEGLKEGSKDDLESLGYLKF